MKYDLVIFDLDGTLLNTLGDLTQATNHALAEAGFPARTEEQVRRAIGNGVARLLRQSAPEGTPEETQASLLAAFKAYYLSHVNDRTLPYPGIPELLAALREKGVHVAVNSNKVDDATRLLCDSHFGGLVELALGERSGMPRKPDPTGARHVMQSFGAAPERTVYVGDGDADLKTAANAGIDAAWVSWGYRRPEELDGLAIPRRFDAVAALGEWLLAD